jgi:hypothetical protein
MHPDYPRVLHTLDCAGIMVTRIRCSNMSDGTKLYLIDGECHNCVCEKKAAEKNAMIAIEKNTTATPKSKLIIENELIGSMIALNGLALGAIAEEHPEETEMKLNEIREPVRKHVVNIDATGRHVPSKKNQAEMLRLQGIMRVNAGTGLLAQLDESDKSVSDKMVGNKPRKIDSVLMDKDLGMEGKMVREYKPSFMNKALSGTITAADQEAITKAFQERESACRAGLPPTRTETDANLTTTVRPVTPAKQRSKHYIAQKQVEEEWIELGKENRAVSKDEEEYDFC